MHLEKYGYFVFLLTPAVFFIVALSFAVTTRGREMVAAPTSSSLRIDAGHPQGRGVMDSPSTPPSLRIDRDYPKLDGAVVMGPIYLPAARAIYHARREVLWDVIGSSLELSGAYQNLLDGKADIIFVPAPSAEQKKKAAAKGIRYTLAPFAREALVFLVNERNPVKNLSIEQIRAIYSGKINDWKEVGGVSGEIKAFQQYEGNGGPQDIMLRDVMRGSPMREPIKVLVQISQDPRKGPEPMIVTYRNQENAIGYEFRHIARYDYVNGEYAPVDGSARLLAVNGVAPTVENIRNGSYPFTNDFYIVTARPLSKNAQKLRAWFLSDEGQRFIEEVGYVPLR